MHAKVVDVPPYYFPATVRAGLPESFATPLRPLPQDGEAEVSTLSQRLFFALRQSTLRPDRPSQIGSQARLGVAAGGCLMGGAGLEPATSCV